MKYYDRSTSRLLQVKRKATADFWDQKWTLDEVGTFNPQSVAPFLDLTRRYLAPGSLVLEGGCGTGGKVAALEAAGFRTIGVDYAKETVARLNNACPQLDIREGDVFSLGFADGHFDGYWSFGVIEHFWGGYQSIFDEARRVLRDNGYFFLTVPCMSPLRRLKATLGLYPSWGGGEREPEGFYQFMLPLDEIHAALANTGFQVLESSVIQAASGAKQEFAALWKLAEILTKLMGGENVLYSHWAENMLGGAIGHIAVIATQLKKTDQ